MKRLRKLSVKEYVFFSILLLLVLGFVLIRSLNKVTYPATGNFSEVSKTSNAKESCLACHGQVTGFSQFHNPENIGCISCHLGNGSSSDKDLAHEGMILIPGNLKDAEATCGKCHSNELFKIQHSLMTTNSGLVAVDKFVFGEADSPDYHYNIEDLGYSAADKHMRDLCANCHLGADKKDYGKITQLSRGGGCNACHLNYSQEAEEQLDAYLESGKTKLPAIHPTTNIDVTDEHCFGCHSRSSRISTNYMGWSETLLDETTMPKEDGFKVFDDKRVYEFHGEDVHHARGMSCIDCHSSHEVMGDGKLHLHAEDAVSLQCSDCHYRGKPNTTTYDKLDTESLLVFTHRAYQHLDKKMLTVQKDRHPLVNTYVDTDGQVYLIDKKDGAKHLIKPQPEICARDKAHQDVSCSSCHSQWTSRCIGCHNSFDPEAKGYDLLDKKEVIGQWIEHVYEFGAGMPALGVRTDSTGKSLVEPAIPGMILTVDNQSYNKKADPKELFHRLYAPNSPHTTSKEVRDCKSCHASAMALGYGKGHLNYRISKGKGKWEFNPEYAASAYDSLPEDAWIPFLGSPKSSMVSTRTTFRPFTVKEQQKMLLVGACLQCHDDNSKVMQQTLYMDFNRVINNLSKHCILPEK